MRRKIGKRIISIVLAGMIAFSNVDATAFAANIENEVILEEVTENEVVTESEIVVEEENAEEVTGGENVIEEDRKEETESEAGTEEETVDEVLNVEQEIWENEYVQEEAVIEREYPVWEETESLQEQETEEMMEEEQEVSEEEESFLDVQMLAEEIEDTEISETENAESTDLQVFQEENFSWGDITPEDQLIYEGDVSRVPKGMWIGGLKEEYTYSGSNITFAEGTENEIRVYDGTKLLKQNTDYTITYKNHKNAYVLTEEHPDYKASKVPTIILKGKGNYSGSITKTFVIKPRDLSQVYEDGTPVFRAEEICLNYNDKVQKGTTKITYVNEAGKTVTLKAKTDFNYSYPHTDAKEEGYDANAFKEAGTYTVVIEGKGNYTGTLEVQEIITKNILISKVKVSPVAAQDFSGEEIKPSLTLKYKQETLTEYNQETGEGDYTLQYKNNRNPGTATVIINGKGEYSGTRTVTFKIKGYELKKAKMSGFLSSVTYTGDEVKQENVTLSYTTGKGADATTMTLEAGKHYTVQYQPEKPVNVGSVTVIYQGIEEEGWSGSIKKSFKIKAYDLKNDAENRIEVEYPQSVSYVKGGAKPKPKVTYTSPEGRQYILSEGADYKLGYTNNKNLNDGSNEKKLPTIKITGKGNFKGTRQEDNFTIVGSDIGNLNMAAADKVYADKKGNYTTTVVVTDVDGTKLKAGTDYEKTFRYYYFEDVCLEDGTLKEAGEEVGANDKVPVGAVLEVVVTGKGIYKGPEEEPATISAFYRVVKEDISKASVKVNKQYYIGKEVCPDKSQIVVTLKGEVLKDKDYEIVSYANNVEKGNAKITIRGVGNYGGSKTVNFVIANKSMYYMISFNANGATTGSMKDLQIKYGQSYALTPNAFTRTGYEFVGWNTESDGSGQDADGNVILYEDRASNPVTVEKNDFGKTLILYAQWKIATYQITYHLNGGSNHEENVGTYTMEDEVVFKEPTREGYTFAGWYTDSGCTKRILSISKGSKGDKNLYAKWRASFLDKVEKPEDGTYLDVRDYNAYPDDALDDTNAIERAVRVASNNYARAKQALIEEYGEAAEEMTVEAVNTVYVPAGIYVITPGHAYEEGEPGINLKSNVRLIMDSEAVLEVVGSSYAEYCVFSVKNAENITMKGGKILGERYHHTGKGGEDGHGISLVGARNIEISNMVISANWGDGVYLGTQPVKQSDGSQLYLGCDNVTVRNCEIVDNRRNNISIVDGDNVTIEHCYIADAHGTAPQCGICIEPNSNSSGDKICRNIILKDTTMEAYQGKNASNYMCFMTHHNPYIDGYTTSDGIKFINCKIKGYVGNYSGKNLKIDSKTVIDGTFDNLR